MKTMICKRYEFRRIESESPLVIFEENEWDDYGYRTLFDAYYLNNNEKPIFIGSIHIAEKNAKKNGNLKYKAIDYFFKDSEETIKKFPTNDENVVSLGNSTFYTELHRLVSDDSEVKLLLDQINDLASDLDLFEEVKNNKVVDTSFLRVTTDFIVKNELHGLATANRYREYSFTVSYKNNDETKSKIKFHTDPKSILPTNIHALIGTNGSGKTTFLKDLVKVSITGKSNIISNFKDIDEQGIIFEIAPTEITSNPIENIYELFESVLFISFSAFDDFEFEAEDSEFKNQFNYVTLYNSSGLSESLEDLKEEDLKDDYTKTIDLNSQYRNQLIKIYESIDKIDELEKTHNKMGLFYNFRSQLHNSAKKRTGENNDDQQKIRESEIKNLVDNFETLSSGQKITLLSISALIANVNQQTLVIFDEPELYLHPPMISSFIRIISELVRNKNGVCIMATHSPIVLQEVPKRCVNIVDKDQKYFTTTRPPTETFGENVSILNDQVFGLDIRKSGFFNFIKDYYNSDHKEKGLTVEELGSIAANYLELLNLRDHDKKVGEG